MNENYERLYGELLRAIELELHKLAATSTATQIECCFALASQYLHHIKQPVHKKFASLGEEIHYYKYVLPKFTAKLEYYTLLYHAELFQPKDDILQLVRYWLREANRLAVFTGQYDAFCRYYQKDETAKDAFYFSGEYAEKYTRFAGTLLALEDYHSYAGEQLQQYRAG